MNKNSVDLSLSISSFQDVLQRGFKVNDSGQQRAILGESDLGELIGLDEIQQNSLYPMSKDDGTTMLKQTLNTTIQNSRASIPYFLKEVSASSDKNINNKNFMFVDKSDLIVDNSVGKQMSRQLSRVSIVQGDEKNMTRCYTQNKSFAEQYQEETKNEDDYDKHGNKYVTPLIWRKNFFKLLLITNRFKFHIKKVLLYFKPLYLSEYQLQAINDKSAQTFQEAQLYKNQSQELYKPKKRSKIEKKIRILYLIFKKQMKWIIVPIQKCVDYIKEQIYILDKQIPLANPFNVIMLLWDFVIILFSVFNLLFVPYQICFLTNVDNHYIKTYKFIREISYTVFFFDMVVQMNTSNYVKVP